MLKQRLPLILAAMALVIALLGTTPLGRAARDLSHAVPRFALKAGFASNAGRVDGLRASKAPKPGYLVPLRSNGKFPASVGQVGPAGAAGTVGPAGPAGPAGASGVTAYALVDPNNGAPRL